MKKTRYLLLLIVLITISCKENTKNNDTLTVVTTTTMLTDLVSTIGGEFVTVNGLMGAGVDPHLYKASEGDVSKLYNAEIIFYGGLHLEGKLVEIFEKMKDRKTTVGLGDLLPKEELIGSEYFASSYDPHVWFNIQYYKEFSHNVTKTLSEADPEHATEYEKNNEAYQKKLDELEMNIQEKISELPKEKRILVTAHDAFNYFGKAYDFEVVGLQGLSTATEAGVQDVQKISEFIIENKVNAIFVESSVPRRTIEALQQSVLSKNHQVEIGGSLYSDALGTKGTPEGTYIGMFTYNVNTIVDALKE